MDEVKRLPRISIVGLGIPETSAMTLEASRVLGQCRTVFAHSVENPMLKSLCKDLRPIGDFGVFWGPDVMAALVGRVLEASRRGPAALVVYGHAMVYEPLGDALLAACRKKKVSWQVVPGISAVDAILAAMGLSLFNGQALQVGDGSYFSMNKPDPKAHVFIYQAFQDKGLFREIMAQCLKVYPKSHRVAVVEASCWRSGSIVWKGLGALSRRLERPNPYATLVIPPCR